MKIEVLEKKPELMHRRGRWQEIVRQLQVHPDKVLKVTFPTTEVAESMASNATGVRRYTGVPFRVRRERACLYVWLDAVPVDVAQKKRTGKNGRAEVTP